MATTTTEIQTATLANGKTALFEGRSCSRCGGSGQYGPMIVHGGRCFKCNGSGVTLTKRGEAASAYYRDLLSKRADELEPGDKIRDLGDGIVSGASWQTVVSVRSAAEMAASGEPLSGGRVYGLDEIEKIEAAIERGATVISRDSGPRRIAVVYEGLVVECDGLTYSGYGAEHKFRVARTGEFKRDASAQARDYQATLTKSGQPRKR